MQGRQGSRSSWSVLSILAATARVNADLRHSLSQRAAGSLLSGSFWIGTDSSIADEDD